MKVFVINLERDKERLEKVDAQLKRLGIDYERIPACDGRKISIAERRKVYMNFRWLCAVGRSATNGEIGCALSHISVYRRIIAEKIELACILEDDVVIDDRFPKVLCEVAKLYDKDKSQIFLLSNHSSGEGQFGNIHLGYKSPKTVSNVTLEKVNGDFCTEAYVLGTVAASALIKGNFPIITPCDWWGRWVRLKLIELYHVFPTVCSQNRSSYQSNTLASNIVSIKELPFLKYIVHKIKRILGVFLDRFLSKLLGF